MLLMSLQAYKALTFFVQMSSTKTINQLRQQRDAMLAGIKHIQDQLEMHRKSIADLEPMLLVIEEGDKGHLRSPRMVKAKAQMDTLKVVPSFNGQIQLLTLFRKNQRI